jgi:hypothetical protein
MNFDVSRFINRLVLAVAVAVFGYIAWTQMIASRGAYPIASTKELTAELAALSVDSGASAQGELELVDRSTIATLDQKYISTNSREEIARHYETSFRSNGWVATGKLASTQDALWFCKKGIHGASYFSLAPVRSSSRFQ